MAPASLRQGTQTGCKMVGKYYTTQVVGEVARKKVLVLGACGNIGPYITPGLESDYDLLLSDVVPHPHGRDILTLDITSYEQVLDASRGMDAIVNFAVVRDSPSLSFHVNTRGTYHIMEAARELGITKVVNTAAQSARYWFEHDFDVDAIPEWPGTGYYMCTKYLGQELSRIYARTYGIQTIYFLFNGLGPSPTEAVRDQDFPPFTVVWEDMQHVCRLALEIDSVPDNFQYFNMLSYLGQGKYSIDKARRILGFEPGERWSEYFRRAT